MYTNVGLVRHVQRALIEKWGYVYGTIGQILTDAVLKQKQGQYPDQINPYLSIIKSTWLGRRTADCVNLIKSYLWWDDSIGDPVYSVKYDKFEGVWMSADGMFQVAKEKGVLDGIPEIPGVCVWRKGHIGVYIGNGQVIESKGTKYGVVQTPLRGPGATTWTHWLKCPLIEYVIIDQIDGYKRIIQEKCRFSNPQGVWSVIDTHPFSRDVYRMWAESYG